MQAADSNSTAEWTPCLKLECSAVQDFIVSGDTMDMFVVCEESLSVDELERPDEGGEDSDCSASTEGKNTHTHTHILSLSLPLSLSFSLTLSLTVFLLHH